MLKHPIIPHLIVLIVAAGLRLYGLGWSLPDVYEEATPLREAWDMWGWGPDRSADFNPHFFNYPSLTIYIQFLVQGVLYAWMKVTGAIASSVDFQVAYFVNKTPFYLAGRAVTAIFGVTTVWLTLLAARRAVGLMIAVGVAALLAINPIHIAKSQVIEVDAPLTCFVMLTMLFALRAMDKPTRREAILAGLALGLAASTKYTGALLMAPMATAFIIAARRDSKSLTTAATNIGIAVAVAAGTFVVTSPFVLLDASTFLSHLSLERHHMAFGHFGLDDSSSGVFYGQILGQRLLGWPLTVLSVLGVIYLTFVRRRPWAIVVSSFVLPYTIVIATWSMRADRYILPILPMLIMMAGGIVNELLNRLRFKGRSGRFEVAVGILIVLMVPSFIGYRQHLTTLRRDTRTLAREWIEANVPSGAFVVSEQYGPQLFGPHEIFGLLPSVRNKVAQTFGDKPQYAVQYIPMFQVLPERSRDFYDLSLYRMSDLLITTGGISSRYRKDRTRFAQQVAFYDSLDTHFVKMGVFTPNGGPGPTINIYRNPAHNAPFAGREDAGRPPELSGRTAPASRFYHALAVNYEAFGFATQAMACYRVLYERFGAQGDMYGKSALGVTRCLLAAGRWQDAVDFIQDAGAKAPTAGDRSLLQSVGTRIVERGPR